MGDTSGAQVGEQTETDADGAHRGALALLCVVSFVVIMDAQIVILALPTIQQALHFGSAASAQWVLSAYLLCFGGLLLLGGRSGDLVGRRRMFLIGTAAFGLSSLACGLAANPATLVAARAVQGVSAAAMAPNALAILVATFTEERARNRAIALWGAMGGVGATGALLIGGGLTSTIGWRWIFLINVPVALVLLALAPRLLRESRGSQTRQRLDAAGAVTLTGGLFAAIYAVVDAPASGWLTGKTIALLAAAAVLLVAFVLIEQRVESPLLPLRLLHSRLLVGGNGAVFATGMCAWGIGLVSSEYAQNVLGFSPIEFGLGSVALTVGAMVGAGAGQFALPRLGGYLLLVTAAVVVVGCALLTQLSVGGSYFADLFAGLTIFGLGLGTITMAGSVAALRDVEDADQGVASGLNTAAFQLGGALGSAVVASVVAAHGGTTPARLTAALNLGSIACVVFAGVAVAFALLLVGRAAARLRSQ